MNQRVRVWGVLLFFAGLQVSNAQEIFLDERFSDWDDSMIIYEDASNDGQNNGIDIGSIWMANDQTYIYIRVELGRALNIQDNNDLTLYIDTDGALATGRKINGIGAEFEYNFGNRSGQLYQADGDGIFIGHEDIDLMGSPTVSSSQFEIGFRRDANLFGTRLDVSGDIQIRLEDNGFNGDDAPDELGGIGYQVKEDVVRDFHDYSLERTDATDFRLLTYNVLADNLFAPSKDGSFRRQFQALQPDIIALQEVRDFSSAETRDKINSFIPDNWFHSKSGFDIVMVSRYPILGKESIGGNAAFLIDVSGSAVLVINIHLFCCDNNEGRQDEVDEIIDYIRRVKAGQTSLQIGTETPIIITGDSNLVGFAQQQVTLLTGDIVNNALYGPDIDPDWDGSDLDDALPLATGTPYAKTWYNPFGSFSSGRLDYIIYTGSTLWRTNTFALSTREMLPSDLSTYQLNLNDSENSSDHLPTVADFQLISVANKDVSFDGTNLYPNPATDFMSFESESSFEEYKIIDQSGKVVLQSRIIGRNIDIRSLTNGSYILSIKNGPAIKFMKI